MHDYNLNVETTHEETYQKFYASCIENPDLVLEILYVVDPKLLEAKEECEEKGGCYSSCIPEKEKSFDSIFVYGIYFIAEQVNLDSGKVAKPGVEPSCFPGCLMNHN